VTLYNQGLKNQLVVATFVKNEYNARPAPLGQALRYFSSKL